MPWKLHNIAFAFSLVSHVDNILLGVEEEKNGCLTNFLHMREEYRSKEISSKTKKETETIILVKNLILSYISIYIIFVHAIDAFI